MRILFFRIGAIGDVLLTTPAVSAVRAKFPDAEIHYMAGRFASKILENNPDINKVIVFNEKYTNVTRVIRVMLMAKELRNCLPYIYDHIVDLESSPYSAMILSHAKSKKRYGFKINKKPLFSPRYDLRFAYDMPDTYITNRALSLVKEVFSAAKVRDLPILKLTDTEFQYGHDFIKNSGLKTETKPVMLCVSATWGTKMWPIENFIECAKAAAVIRPVVILWGPGDEEKLKIFREANIQNVFFAPPCTLRELASILSLSSLLISNDNGVRHIATALNIKTIGIFGPTNEKGWAFTDNNNKVLVSDAPCRPCDLTRCIQPSLICMEKISPETIIGEMKKMLY